MVFSGLSSIRYYNGYLYISAKNLTSRKNNMIIYRVSLDGTKQEIIYNSSESMQQVVIHRRKHYVYEQAFDKEGIILTIRGFPLNSPKEIR